jgi:hypothetical protein
MGWLLQMLERKKEERVRRVKRKLEFFFLAQEALGVAGTRLCTQYERITLLRIFEKLIEARDTWFWKSDFLHDYWVIPNFYCSKDEPIAASIRSLPIFKKIGMQYCCCLEEEKMLSEAANCAKLYGI